MAKISNMKAINLACFDEFARDDKVIVIGEAVGKKGGAWGYFTGLMAKFGSNRMLDMPIAEPAFCAFACGTTLAGYRPIVEFMFADFVTIGLENIMNMAAKQRYNSGGVNSCPIVYLLPQGGGASGSQHSQSVEAWMSNMPGIKIVAPTFPGDMKKYLQASIRDDDPVVFIFQRAIFGLQEEVPDNLPVPGSLLNASRVVKEGTDVTIVAYQRALINSIQAAKELEEEGISVEIIDPIVLRPLDTAKMFASVRKTGRCLIVHEAPKIGGFGMQISALIAENCLGDLAKPIVRLGGKEQPIAFGKACDLYMFPKVEEIKAEIRALVR